MHDHGSTHDHQQNVVPVKRALNFEGLRKARVNEQPHGNFGKNQNGLSWHQKDKGKQGAQKYGKGQGKKGKRFVYALKENQQQLGETSKSHLIGPKGLDDCSSGSGPGEISESGHGKVTEVSGTHLSDNEKKMLQAFATEFQNNPKVGIEDLVSRSLINNGEVKCSVGADADIVNSEIPEAIFFI